MSSVMKSFWFDKPLKKYKGGIRMKNKAKRMMLGLVASALVAGCAHLSFYDAKTDGTLTRAKQEVVALYDTFTQDPADNQKIGGVRAMVSDELKYEQAKPDNVETAKQVSLIQGMFERQVQSRLKDGPWNSAVLNNNKENISDAFDSAIRTERSKNRR